MLSFSGTCFLPSGRTAAVGRLELDRAEIVLTVAVEVLVVVHLEVTVVSGVLVASAIEGGIVEMLAMVPAAITLVVMGLGIVEVVVVGIVQVYAEQPTSGINVHGTEEVVQSHEKAVLAAAQHPTADHRCAGRGVHSSGRVPICLRPSHRPSDSGYYK